MDAVFSGRVLVVEDDPSIRDLLMEVLEQEGLTVVACADGEQAVAAAEKQRPVAVVLDMALPLLDGPTVAGRISDLYGDQVPLIVVTASRPIEVAAARVRASSYIAKPFDVADVVDAVRAAIAPPSALPSAAVEPSPASSTQPAT
jgi:two-component system, OmpR family, response regulator